MKLAKSSLSYRKHAGEISQLCYLCVAFTDTDEEVGK